MTTEQYLIATAVTQTIALGAYYFVQSDFRKRQQLVFTAIVRRILNVKTKEEFQNVFRRFAGNEIRTLSYKQRNELFSLKEVLEANLI